MKAKKFFKPILKVTLIVLAFSLLLLTVRMLRPVPDPDPINHIIQATKKVRLTDMYNNELVREWLYTLIYAGREDDAIEVARQTKFSEQRFQFYLYIADALKRAGKADKVDQALQQAFVTTTAIERPDARYAAIAKLAALKGDTESAFDNLLKIEKGSRVANTTEVCQIFIQQQNFEAAFRAAHDDLFRPGNADLLLELSEALMKADQIERARSTAQEALTLAQNDFNTLGPFAGFLTRLGFADQFVERFQYWELMNNYKLLEIFESVAIGLAETGDIDKAVLIVRRMSPVAVGEQADVLVAISEVVRKAGDKDRADTILTEALDTAVKSVDSGRSNSLSRIAPVLVKAGRTDEALQLVRDYLSNDEESLALVAVALLESGKIDAANSIVADIFAREGGGETSLIRSRALIELVKAARKAGRPDDAMSYINRASQAVIANEARRYQKDSHLKPAMKSIVRRWSRIFTRSTPVSDHSNDYGYYSYIIIGQSLAMMQKSDQAIAIGEIVLRDEHRLFLFTAIVRECAIARNPALVDLFESVNYLK